MLSNSMIEQIRRLAVETANKKHAGLLPSVGQGNCDCGPVPDPAAGCFFGISAQPAPIESPSDVVTFWVKTYNTLRNETDISPADAMGVAFDLTELSFNFEEGQ